MGQSPIVTNKLQDTAVSHKKITLHTDGTQTGAIYQLKGTRPEVLHQLPNRDVSSAPTTVQLPPPPLASGIENALNSTVVIDDFQDKDWYARSQSRYTLTVSDELAQEIKNGNLIIRQHGSKEALDLKGNKATYVSHVFSKDHVLEICDRDGNVLKTFEPGKGEQRGNQLDRIDLSKIPLGTRLDPSENDWFNNPTSQTSQQNEYSTDPRLAQLQLIYEITGDDPKKLENLLKLLELLNAPLTSQQVQSTPSSFPTRPVATSTVQSIAYPLTSEMRNALDSTEKIYADEDKEWPGRSSRHYTFTVPDELAQEIKNGNLIIRNSRNGNEVLKLGFLSEMAFVNSIFAKDNVLEICDKDGNVLKTFDPVKQNHDRHRDLFSSLLQPTPRHAPAQWIEQLIREHKNDLLPHHNFLYKKKG